MHVAAPDLSQFPEGVSFKPALKLSIPVTPGELDPSETSVTYQLVGKVIFRADHYLAQVLLHDGSMMKTFSYDDMRKGRNQEARLKVVGSDTHILEPPHVSSGAGIDDFYVYVRTSSHSPVIQILLLVAVY